MVTFPVSTEFITRDRMKVLVRWKRQDCAYLEVLTRNSRNVWKEIFGYYCMKDAGWLSLVRYLVSLI